MEADELAEFPGRAKKMKRLKFLVLGLAQVLEMLDGQLAELAAVYEGGALCGGCSAVSAA